MRIFETVGSVFTCGNVHRVKIFKKNLQEYSKTSKLLLLYVLVVTHLRNLPTFFHTTKIAPI